MRWFVPGRLEVLGKHTDYAGGRSLLAAVDRGITVTLDDADHGLTAHLSLSHDGGMALAFCILETAPEI